MQKSGFFCIFLHWAPTSTTSATSAAIVPRLGAPLARRPPETKKGGHPPWIPASKLYTLHSTPAADRLAEREWPY